MKRHRVSINDLNVYYSEFGSSDKPTMIFLHGGGSFITHYKDLLQNLGNNYHVIGIDLPGFGISDIPPLPRTFTGYAEFLENFISKLNINPRFIIGHSFGGAIVAKYTELNTAIDSKIILIDPVPTGFTYTKARLVPKLIHKSIVNFFYRNSNRITSLRLIVGVLRFLLKLDHISSMFKLLGEIEYKLPIANSNITILRGNDDLLFTRQEYLNAIKNTIVEYVEIEGGHDWCLITPDLLPKYLDATY